MSSPPGTRRRVSPRAGEVARRFLVAAGLAALAVAAGACGGDDEPTGGSGETREARETGTIDPARRHQVDKMSAHEIAAAPNRSGGRIARVDGTARRGDTAVAVGDVFAPGDLLETEAHAHITVDLVREVRVEVGAGSALRRGGVHEAEVFLVRGVIRGTLPPVGGGSRPALRVGTPAGTVVVPDSGDVLIAALPSGDTWVAAFSGAAVLGRGDIDGEAGARRTATTRLLEGSAMLLGRSAIAEATAAPARIEAGWATAEQLVAGAPRSPAAERQAAAASAGLRFDEAASWLAAEQEGGEALAEQQRELMQSDPDRARELTRDIVAHSQRVIRLKAIVLGRFEQAAAAAEVAGDQISEARAERAADLLTDGR